MVSPDRSNKSAIVDNVRNLVMNETGETYLRLVNEGKLGEIHDLTSMMHNLYSIMKTGKSPQGGKAKYSVSEAMELKGKLIELGMPLHKMEELGFTINYKEWLEDDEE